MTDSRVAIIVGTGALGAFPAAEPKATLETPFGPVSLLQAAFDDLSLTLLPRHGRDHDRLPHRINHHAHLWALREAGARWVLATTAVGSMNPALPPGSLAALSDFIDCTRSGPHTYAHSAAEAFTDLADYHMDVTEPYSARAREALLAAAQADELPLASQAVYVGVDGPRYETPAEIRMFRQLGGDVMGMTGVAEAVLAQELGLAYASVGIITNWAAGISCPLQHREVTVAVERVLPQLRAILLGAARMLAGA